jgi:D-mannonate dehydratase
MHRDDVTPVSQNGVTWTVQEFSTINVLIHLRSTLANGYIFCTGSFSAPSVFRALWIRTK